MPLTREQLRAMFAVIRETQPIEIDSDRCLIQIGEFAEQRLARKPASAGMEAVAQPLLICAECREEFEAHCQAISTLQRPGE